MVASASARAMAVSARLCSWLRLARPEPSSAVAATSCKKTAMAESVKPLRPSCAKSAAVSTGLPVLPAAVVSRLLTVAARVLSSPTLSTLAVVCAPRLSLSKARPEVLVAIAPKLTPMAW